MAVMATCLLLGASLAGCAKTAANSSKSDGMGSSTSASSGGSSSDNMEASMIKAGEMGTSGDWEITVKGVEMMSAAGGATAPAGTTLAVVTFDLKNKAAMEAGISQTAFKLSDADENEFKVVPTSDPKFIFNTPQPIKAGEMRTIKIAYAAKEGTKEFMLTFTPTMADGSKANPVLVKITM